MTKNDSGVKFYIASQEKPVAPSTSESDLQAKLDAAEHELAEVKAAAGRKAQDADRLVQEWQEKAKGHGDRATDLESQLQKAKAEYADFVQASERTVKQYQQERDGLQAKLDTLTKERSDLQAKMDGFRPLPTDALDRLKAVKGIGDDLAQKALDALTAEGGQK